jgi:TRAP-type mannitol/chloroaromatic compound transport system substrate-binding protein
MAMINQHNPYTDLKLHKQDVEKYLLSHGWQPVEHPFKNLQVFDGLPDDEGKPIRLAIPAADHFRDADRRIYEAIETIAGVEDRSIDAVTADIKKISGNNGAVEVFCTIFP